ncbi:hypothetical protein EHN07_18825 [Buttiauxella warmboldiae]|uniref:Uncharacterized protein n=1 Tax=Buttiauxella warmboldiae TaxID=82993 RepID=A0A3N5DKE3_9ENTR|nr:hypothetical protein EHN07_18825 [Buttiauxella warmboldiae]
MSCTPLPSSKLIGISSLAALLQRQLIWRSLMLIAARQATSCSIIRWYIRASSCRSAALTHSLIL